jgi:catechol 2,3-dioxygenase-like lactoylglutathione lyase family enzyme
VDGLARELDQPSKERNDMLSDKDAIATVAVKNLETARKFYEGTLGLTKVMENEEVLAFKTGKSTLFVYRSPHAGTNKATAVTFVAEEVDDLVRTLKGRGVTFEHYVLPNLTVQGDLHVAGPMKVAWFKDPDGNIFSLVTPTNTAGRQAVGTSARSTT